MATTPRHEVPSSTQAALHLVAERAIRYTQEIADRRVSPAASDVENLSRFHEPLPEQPCDLAKVIVGIRRRVLSIPRNHRRECPLLKAGMTARAKPNSAKKRR